MKIFLIFFLLIVSTAAQVQKVGCSLSKDCGKGEYCRNHECTLNPRQSEQADRHLVDRHKKPTGSDAGDGKRNYRIHHG
ncbi:hypothetical protein CAEBREN_18981 [Caenorhabditis brenneri]|uniref:Uncharacterized protein n=1 Tax=Caenorhabditis brenneri TaxID=135651 RepID=G0NEN4_CAEBE|nr:hypothetical protein CAEBREN_18981 [Caenorhabditis brenneri]